MSKVRGQKRQLEKARQERAAAKRERRQGGKAEGAGAPEDGEEPREEVDQDVVLAKLAELHQRYGDGGMSLDEFEETRDELVQLLRVD